MNIRAPYPLAAILLFSACIYGCGGAVINESSRSDPPNPSDTVDIEDDIKNQALQGASGAASGTLTVERSFQSDGRGPLVYPVSLAALDKGGVYISDNNAHRIDYYPPDSNEIVALPSQVRNGRLEWPNTIRLVKDSILVSDNDGIKVFKRNGSFQYLLRIYYQASSFAVDAAGNIYANPHFAIQKPSDPLIVKLNNEGTLIRRFGTRLSLSDHFGLDDKAFLCCAGSYIFVAFMYRPEVQVYDAQGRFIREFRIEHSCFDKLARLLSDERFTHPSKGTVRLPRYVAGLSVVEDRLLVLLDLPRAEVAELDFQGHELAHYSSNYQPFPHARYRAFDAKLVGNAYRFWTIIGTTRETDFAIIEYTCAKTS